MQLYIAQNSDVVSRLLPVALADGLSHIVDKMQALYPYSSCTMLAFVLLRVHGTRDPWLCVEGGPHCTCRDIHV